MDEKTKKLIEQKLTELTDILSTVGPQFRLASVEHDNDGTPVAEWSCNFTRHKIDDDGMLVSSTGGH